MNRSMDRREDFCDRILFFNSAKFPSTEADVAVSYGDLKLAIITFDHNGNSFEIRKS